MKPRLLYKNSTRFVAIVFAMLLGASAALGQTSSFTYQGRLTDGGTAANGNYDLQFALFDSLSSGTQIGSTQSVNTVAVSNGVFTVSLDFGASSFSGASRFLEISARPSGAGSFTLLTPRQSVTSTPYAVRSASTGNADTATNATNATTATNATQLGGVAAGQYVQTNDSRLTDARTPTPGSSNYIQNTSSAQSGNFNISGNGTIGGNLFANGSLGIGTTSPQGLLHVFQSNAGADAIGGEVVVNRFLSGGSWRGGAMFDYFPSAFGHDVLAFGVSENTIAPNSLSAVRMVIGANGNVGIGTASPQATLDVRGIIKLGGSGQFFATGAEENLCIIRGVISGAGDILVGSGFSVFHGAAGSGQYIIIFNTCFQGLPAVTATADSPDGTERGISTRGVLSCSANIRTYNNTSAVTDAPFHFIAIGPR